MFKTGILTISDSSFKGQRKDLSGPLIKKIIKNKFKKAEVSFYAIVPDEKEKIKKLLLFMCDDLKLDLILTTGGTGFAQRDVTPEATLKVIEKETPGVSEFIRLKSLSKSPRAILSRAVSGIRKKSLIINLPGSPKAVKEILGFILPVIPHGMDVLKGTITQH